MPEYSATVEGNGYTADLVFEDDWFGPRVLIDIRHADLGDLLYEGCYDSGGLDFLEEPPDLGPFRLMLSSAARLIYNSCTKGPHVPG